MINSIFQALNLKSSIKIIQEWGTFKLGLLYINFYSAKFDDRGVYGKVHSLNSTMNIITNNFNPCECKYKKPNFRSYQLKSGIQYIQDLNLYLNYFKHYYFIILVSISTAPSQFTYLPCTAIFRILDISQKSLPEWYVPCVDLLVILSLQCMR